MMLLVIGRGAEDVEDELGRLVADLEGGLADVVGLDLHVNAYTCLSREPDDVVSWLRTEYNPTLILIVDTPETIGFGPSVIVPLGVRTTRPAALSALRAWSEPPGGSAELEGDALHLLEALLRAFLAPTARLQVTERAPRVSVITAVYNQEAYLHATVRSLLADTYDDYEVVVVDDGSTDASPEILRQYAGNRRLSVVSTTNVGGTGRMDLVWNRGIRAASGDLLAFLGGDDVSLPHRLSAQVAAFDEDPRLGVCHSAAHTIDPTGRRFGNGLTLPVAYDDLSFLRDMQSQNLVAHPTAMLSRAALATVGPYEEGLACDYHWWMKAANRVRFRYLPQRLVEYRIHDRSLSTTAEGSQRCAREAYRHRQIVVQRRSLADFFPELAGCTDAHTWQEAGLSLGNSLIHIDPMLAGYAYDLAAEALPSHEVFYNSAVAYHLRGERRSAMRAAESAARLSARAAALHTALLAGTSADVELFGPGERLAAAVSAGRERVGAQARRWDGSPIDVRSAYVSLGRTLPDWNEKTVTAWSSTRADSRLRWVYPDLGLGFETALARLAEAASSAADLSAAADIAIEAVDDFGILPPDSSRPTGELSSAEHHEQFTAWTLALA